MNEWVFLFPGQGSQYVGMGRDLYENYSDVRELFHRANEILGMDIISLCFEGPEDVLVQTKNVQPAITVVNLACFIVLQLHEIKPAATAGHSLGEYSALYAAGVLDIDEVLNLVKWRGYLMQKAAEKNPGSMAAIINLEEKKLEELCRLCGVEIANINSPDQVIISGSREAIRKAMEKGREMGALRTIELNVSGPWHSQYMAEAQEAFKSHVEACHFRDPRIPVITNVDAQPLASGADAPSKLIKQLCSPVFWNQSMRWFIKAGYRNFVEVGPKKVLRGLMRRIDKKVTTLNVEDSVTLTTFLNANGN